MIRQLRNAVYSRLSLIWFSELRPNMTFWVWLHLNREHNDSYLRDLTAKLDSRQGRKLATVNSEMQPPRFCGQTALSQG